MTTQAGDENRIPVAVWRAGKAWNGFYVIEPAAPGGKRLLVCSAYGSRAEPLGRKQPGRLAERLLGEILDAYAARPRKRKRPPA